MKTRATPTQLSTLLKKAFQQRNLLLPGQAAYRLINGAADQLAYVTIDVFNDVFILRTTERSADALIDPLAQILKSEFGAKAVLLKNHNETRRKAGLPLADKILKGGLIDNCLSFEESGARYDFDTSDFDVFSLEDRPMRAFLRTFYPTTIACLAATPRAEGLLPCDHQNPTLHHIPLAGLDFSALTSRIRETSHPTNLFDIGVLDLSLFKISPEHRKASFHLLHGFLKQIRADGYLHIKTQNWQETNKIVSMIATKGRRQVKLMTLENSGADFAVAAGLTSSLYITFLV